MELTHFEIEVSTRLTTSGIGVTSLFARYFRVVCALLSRLSRIPRTSRFSRLTRGEIDYRILEMASCNFKNAPINFTCALILRCNFNCIKYRANRVNRVNRGNRDVRGMRNNRENNGNTRKLSFFS